ncbi:hypothetical protein BJ138DRAFT_1152000 [Hygrophoropsis aurantiaca]|uniref:Uncharacterized protein n=1 Tax=Hygrophoropsis aurantiaca TaxID=72124 RepID=A0ACB8ABK9_9AGAM|nr:hypothetical protein BJ138DRAFT_1152000 [Hygrophoropsis aurantiaca]
MPSFSCSSTIRVVSGNHALTLKIKHNYFYREQSQTITKIKGRLPKDLDILLSSDLVLTLSGSLDGTDVANDVIVHSAISEHLRRCIRTNIKELGVNNISDLFIDEADGVTKMTLTSSRSPPRISRPHANLVSIDLAYIWKNTRRNTDQGPERNVNLLSNDDNPFSTQLFLPFESVLNRVTDQFMTYHLVG